MNLTVELTLILALLLSFVFFTKPKIGLYTLLFCIPFERIGSWVLNPTTGHPTIRLSQLVGAALVLAFIYRFLAGKEKIKFHPVFIPLALFALSATVSFLLIGKAQLTTGLAALYLAIAICFVVAQLVRTANLELAFNVLIISALTVALFGLYQFIGGSLGLPPSITFLTHAYERSVFGFPRIQSTAVEPLYFANYLLIPLLLGASLFFIRPKELKLWHLLAFLVIFLSFILTMSRGAFIAIIPAFLVILGLAITFNKIRVNQLLLGLFLFLACCSIGIMLLTFASSKSGTGNGFKTFFYQITKGVTATASYTERTEMRHQAEEIFKQHPWFGVGIEGIAPYVRHYPATRTPADAVSYNNQFLELLDETGIIGALLFYVFLGLIVAYGLSKVQGSKQSPNAWAVGLICIVIAITIQAQSFSGFLITYIWMIYGLLAGIIIRDDTISA